MNHRIPPASYSLTLDYEGSRTFDKMSYPVHCGVYSILQSQNYIFHINLNGEVIRIKDRTRRWNHPHEWLQRTVGNDWVYYSTGGYTGVYEATGEYYLPNFNYSSNSILGGKPFESEEIKAAVKNWHDELTFIFETCSHPDENILLGEIVANSPKKLAERAKQFHSLIGGRISVLPPDARHVHYNLIPITISRGCLYKCGFCKVKNKHTFQELQRSAIDTQIAQLRDYFGKDLRNYNSIFLGQHDALHSNSSTILTTIESAVQGLEMQSSYLNGSNCFLFGSISSFLNCPESLFKNLQELPPHIYINIGLESPDQETLNQLGKPVSSAMVHNAFNRIGEINRRYSTIEVTANLLMDGDLPDSHYSAVEKLLRNSQTFQQSKGSIYFSPLSFNSPARSRLFEFNRLKLMSRYPTYLYIIQRL